MSGGKDTKAISEAPWLCDLRLLEQVLPLLQRMTRKLRQRLNFQIQIVEHDDNHLQVWVRWWKKEG